MIKNNSWRRTLCKLSSAIEICKSSEFSHLDISFSKDYRQIPSLVHIRNLIDLLKNKIRMMNNKMNDNVYYEQVVKL